MARPIARCLVTLSLALALLGASVAPTMQRASVPGATDPNVTQETIYTTICVAGYTKTVRPPVAYTDAIKHRLMREQNLPGRTQDYELDHLLAIEDGGHPRSLDNLWMQPLAEARIKDVEESRLHHAVCAGTITLHEAQNTLLQAWGPIQHHVVPI